ncbi:sensor histidine kinase [Mucilaginibacter lappiensis]|uniref:histidine kinase n=1 Tax=Mucilaginibacter lappiensis TaxID=354630 RepID=A0A1N6T5F8_9SPHI|nr:ATP-binding protein [Mucilaginibacter lappiensis]MBB6108186.1 two-component system phosphate regulon sensor histidine kinase PhoR [Mucilaginibacter lappiensis]MBB6130328.1 two-component system phosphate regulon sensor histidine kinase PhoR [Mucilaginibacter lappiensis]SIQ48484.1 two-component system, OmpR family, phosphate regulon sensor histidine kinase PhoR [Mucilaginibacter lappiensis]
MNLRVLVLITALGVAITLSAVNFYFQHKWYDVMVTFLATLITSYVVFYYLIEKYIYSRIKLIYKLIHNLKLGRDLRDALGEHVSANPINDVESEVKEWAKQKKIEIDELRKQEKFRRDFLSNISHEFKTPLFAIQGYIEALQDDDFDDRDMARQFLEKASKNVDRLSYLIKDLDEISKLESGEIPINYSKFKINDLIKEVFESLEIKGKQYHIKLIFKQKYDEGILVYADREKIRQVLVNLIDNSFKYGKEEGSTSVSLFVLHDQVLVEVTDDGIGIEEKFLPRLFERFYRTDSSRSRQIGGSGLGLAIVKHIIEAHQQTINVRSTEGLGSTFGFTLQIAKQTLHLPNIPVLKS